MSEIEIICRQLCESIDVIINSKSDVNERNIANQYIETFKSNENVLLLLNVSLKLLNENVVDSNKSIVYKHFGLQLLQTVIRFHWNSIDNKLKEEIKQLIESWFDTPLNPNQLRDNNWRHLMNGSGRCIVEVIIREWPQNWPQLMSVLLRNESTLSLYCIWQLAEDIGISFKPQNGQRRREITNEFNRNITQIYSYISKCVNTSDLDLILTSVSTLNVLFECNQFDTNLLQIMVQMLANDCNDSKYIQIKQSICDCLIVTLNRKQLKTNEKIAIQTLFTDLNISLIVSTVRKYIESNAKESEVHSLVKRLVSVMSELSEQLITHFEDNFVSGNAWNQCIQIMFALFSHSNVVFNAISVHFWILFIKNFKHLSERNAFDKSFQSSIISLIPHKISKQVFDKSINGFDFDDIEDFDAFFFKFRADIIELLRQLTILDQKLCFDFVSELLNKALIQSNVDRTDWEILAQMSAAVFNKITDKNLFFDESAKLLQLLMQKGYKEDPDILSSQLSCISALTVFFPHISNELLNQIIRWTLLLSAFTSGEQNKWTRSKEVKNLRRHSCSLFIKMCQTFPLLLIPLFNDLKAHIHSICSDVQQYSQMEKCALNEGLILISNEFPNIEHQKQFVEELIESINWINNYNVNCDQFFCEIGLTQNSLEDDEFGHKRANLTYVVNLMLSLLKRIKNERQIVLMPSMFCVINGLFSLVSNLNSIWRPEYRQKCSENFRSLVFSDINETDKMNILDLVVHTNQHFSNKSDSYRMQNFVWNLHESCYNALGLSVAALKQHMYDYINDFKPLLIDIEFVPEWKLRMIIKNFVKPLIYNCPQSLNHYQKIGPIVTTLIPFVFNKVNNKWMDIRNRNQCSNNEMNDWNEPIESELITDQINRLLSREFIELMVAILNPSKSSDCTMEYSNQMNESNELVISEFGNYLLNSFPNVIIYPTAKALSWLDTNISLKTCQLNSVLIRKIINDNMIRNEDSVYFLLEQLLIALSFFGEHEQNQSILLNLMLFLYEGIAIKSDSIKVKLSEITGTDIKDWIDFDQKLIKNMETKDKILYTEKRKKEFLKKLVSQVIGKNIGQLYKYNNVEIKNLRPIFCNKNRIPNTTTDEDLSLCLLFNDS